MYAIGSYAVPQIQSVNPDINIDSFTVPPFLPDIS